MAADVRSGVGNEELIGEQPASTIFALSSGSPPAGIAIIRISGERAGKALTELAGLLPPPRTARLARLRRPSTGMHLDDALVLWFPGPRTATGEDLAELHVHGGRAVVAAIENALGELAGLRRAQPGEFTRRAFQNGRIDLAEAEGLSDLLAAETESQRRHALAITDGVLSRTINGWREELLKLSARVEAALDFADEDDVPDADPRWGAALADMADDMAKTLARPAAERLRDGIRVALAGPPNSGKSTLFNALVGREAAITSEAPGTTRDLIEAPVALAGTAFLLIDTAGLRDSSDAIEQIGVLRAQAALGAADIVLWLGEASNAPHGGIRILARADERESSQEHGYDIVLSARTGLGMAELIQTLVERAGVLLPREDEVALNARQRAALREARDALCMTSPEERDPLLLAETLRLARAALDRLLGRAGVEDMLDQLFGQFCIGK